MKEKNLILVRRIVSAILAVYLCVMALAQAEYYTVTRVIFIVLVCFWVAFAQAELGIIKSQYGRIAFIVTAFVLGKLIGYWIQWGSTAIGFILRGIWWIVCHVPFLGTLFGLGLALLIGYIIYNVIISLKIKKKKKKG